MRSNLRQHVELHVCLIRDLCVFLSDCEFCFRAASAEDILYCVDAYINHCFFCTRCHHLHSAWSYQYSASGHLYSNIAKPSTSTAVQIDLLKAVDRNRAESIYSNRDILMIQSSWNEVFDRINQ